MIKALAKRHKKNYRLQTHSLHTCMAYGNVELLSIVIEEEETNRSVKMMGAY